MQNEPRKPQPEDTIELIDDEDEQEWQDLIDSIEATDVPIEMLKYLRVHLEDGTKMIFPIVRWNKEEGVDFEEIKNLVSNWYKKHENEILGSDFIVNLTKLKSTVKSETQRILKDL